MTSTLSAGALSICRYSSSTCVGRFTSTAERGVSTWEWFTGWRSPHAKWGSTSVRTNAAFRRSLRSRACWPRPAIARGAGVFAVLTIFDPGRDEKTDDDRDRHQQQPDAHSPCTRAALLISLRCGSVQPPVSKRIWRSSHKLGKLGFPAWHSKQRHAPTISARHGPAAFRIICA